MDLQKTGISLKAIQMHERQNNDINNAYVNYMFAWKGENDEEESAIILPTIQLKKRDDTQDAN